MTPRLDTAAVSSDATVEEAIETCIRSGHARLPACEGSLDNVTGVFDIRDPDERDYGTFADPEVADVVTPTLHVPEPKTIDDLLTEIRENRMHMVTVIDEFGATEGVITMEDMTEDIVGEILAGDEERPIEFVDDDTVLVNGSVDIEEVNDALGTVPPEGEEFETITGFVFNLAGRLVEQGEAFDYEDVRLRAEQVENTRIQSVRVSVDRDTGEAPSPTGEADTGRSELFCSASRSAGFCVPVAGLFSRPGVAVRCRCPTRAEHGNRSVTYCRSMMATTHALAGMALGSVAVVVAPEYALLTVLAGAVGGAFPDLDLAGAHRETLHFPVYYSVAALVLVPVAALAPTPVTVTLAAALAAAALHSLMDAIGGGLSLRPWEGTSDRAVYDHFNGRWVRPRRWVRYDGAPEDLALAVGFAVVPFTVVTGRLRVAVVGLVAVSVLYALVRKPLVDAGERLVAVLPPAVLDRLPRRFLEELR
jgi:Mg2+/Co2+ transporter CorC